MDSDSMIFLNEKLSFYTKLIKDDDLNIHSKITELIPMVEDAHQLKFLYTLIKSANRLGYLEKDDYVRYIRSALERAAGSTTCTDAITAFQLVLQKAVEDGVIDEHTKYRSDQSSESTLTVNNEPFAKELWEHIYTYTERVPGLEMCVKGLEAPTERLEARAERIEACSTDFYLSLVKVQKGIMFNHNVEVVSGMMRSLLHAISFGAVGSDKLRRTMKLAMNRIVDFGDLSHVQDVVMKLGDATLRDTLDHALATVEQLDDTILFQCETNECNTVLKGPLHTQLIQAASDGNPLMAVVITAHVMSNNYTSPVSLDGNVTNCPPQRPMRIMDRIRNIERELCLEKVPTVINKRIENLELNIYGEVHSGTLVERIIFIEKDFEINFFSV